MITFRYLWIAAFAVFGVTACAQSGAVASLDASPTEVEIAPDVTVNVSTGGLDVPVHDVDVATTDTGADDDATAELDAKGTVCPVPSGLHCVPGESAVAEALASAPSPAFEGHFLCELALGTPSPCEDHCDLGECVASGDVSNYVADVVEYVVDMQLSEPGCCFDFDGDGEVDNAIGTGLDIGAGLRGGIADIDITISQAVHTGRAVLAMTRTTRSGESWLALIQSYHDLLPPFFEYPPAQPVAMRPRATSFISGTVTPRSRLRITSDGDDWIAVGDVLRVDLPIGLEITLPLVIRGVRLRLTKTDTGSHVALGGYALLSELLDSMNATFSAGGDCECMGAVGPIYGMDDGDPSTYSTAPGVPIDASGCAPESYCGEFAVLAATGLLGDVLRPDLDVNGDGILDALSVGVSMRTLPGVLTTDP